MADCINLLGGPRGVKYVAQENLEPLQVVMNLDEFLRWEDYVIDGW